MNNLNFKNVIIKEDNGYSALCLDVDIATDGDTIEKVKENLREAISLYTESAIESNLPIIRPVALNDNPIITRKDDVIEIL
jgi:predicted RNase H-like HicB family nuclease